MKKISYTLLAVFTTLSLASCDEGFKEKNGSDSPEINANTIAFKLDRNDVETRSSDGSPVISRQIIPMGDPIDGVNYFLEETVTLLEGTYAPETKGTPVYTENFSKLFNGQFYGLARDASGTVVIPDDAFTDNGNGIWNRYFTSNPFGENDELYFYLRAPQTVAGLTDLTYSTYSSGRTQITFTYTPPFIASEQQDIVFAARSVNKGEAEDCIPVLFNHMLTGIKFAIANKNDEYSQTYISQVELRRGLHKYAKFTYRSTWESGKWVDNPNEFSSSGAVSVDSQTQLTASESYKLLAEPADITPVDFTSGTFENNGAYPASFKQKGNTANLNDSDGSLTFWLVPQKVNSQAEMVITFHVISAGKDSGPITRTINIGQLLTNVNWKAGELRTYTLKGELLDVDIEDKVTGFEKTDVVITNTGNVPAFIRASIIANWCGKAGEKYSVATGYANETTDDFLPAWRMSGTDGDNFGGVFEGLPGTKWVQGSDGFFYYTDPVPAGQKVPNKLFTKYSISGSNIPPKVWYIDPKSDRYPFTDVELVMEIPVQAIEAEEGKTYIQAWAAVGVNINN